MPNQNLRVTHEEVTPIPGGKRHHYECQTTLADGTLRRFKTEVTRIDTDSSYTLELTMHIQSGDAELQTVRQTIFGHKGEIDGNVRHDRVFLTLWSADGSSTQEERNVPVRLDLGHLENESFATLLMRGPDPAWGLNLSCDRRGSKSPG
jgi:hypothetical protein